MEEKHTSADVVDYSELRQAFGNSYSSYNLADKRRYLEQKLLDKFAGVYIEYTITEIMVELKLLTKKNRLTKRGKSFLYHAFRSNY